MLVPGSGTRTPLKNINANNKLLLLFRQRSRSGVATLCRTHERGPRALPSTPQAGLSDADARAPSIPCRKTMATKDPLEPTNDDDDSGEH